MLQSKEVLLTISCSLVTSLLFRVDLQFLFSHNRLSECICLICQSNLKLKSSIKRKKADWSNSEKLDHYVNVIKREG